ncbi:MAG: HNH endonuclease [Syntrophobacteraceae bacterium]
METGGCGSGFIIAVSPEQLRKEKEKARELRGSQWWKRQTARGVCHYCHRGVPPSQLTMDHIVPLVRGGKSARGNTVPACKECNNKKKYLLPLEWDHYLRRAAKDPPPGKDEPGQTPVGE